MNHTVLFKFNADKAHNRIAVERIFRAARPLVWHAWTDAGILDHWWAPKPWQTETRSMDFREGGRWLYAMAGPEGERHWSFMHYTTIRPETFFASHDGFCDENGVVDPSLPTSTWENRFEEQGDQTIVSIDIQFETLEDLEKIIEMGFKEGFESGLNNLEEYLATNAPS